LLLSVKAKTFMSYQHHNWMLGLLHLCIIWEFVLQDVVWARTEMKSYRICLEFAIQSLLFSGLLCIFCLGRNSYLTFLLLKLLGLLQTWSKRMIFPSSSPFHENSLLSIKVHFFLFIQRWHATLHYNPSAFHISK
jgi:hypothetical protein